MYFLKVMEQTFDPNTFFCQLHKLHLSSALTANPICSMYGISNTYIYHKDPPNAGRFFIEHMGLLNSREENAHWAFWDPVLAGESWRLVQARIVEGRDAALLDAVVMRKNLMSSGFYWEPLKKCKSMKTILFLQVVFMKCAISLEIGAYAVRDSSFATETWTIHNCWLFTSSQICKTLQRFLSEHKSPNP